MNEDRSNLIIAHFLALDHIGHSTSSLTHDQFTTQKEKISDYLETVIAHMKNNDLLLVTGDHGMRTDGNHGGSSSDEVETFLFVYSKSKKIINILPDPSL